MAVSPPSVPASLLSREATALRRWVTVAGIALILAIIAADSYEAWADYRRTVHDNERLQLALGRALAEQTARMVQEADVVLSDYAAWMEARGGASADEAVRAVRLKRTVTSLPFVSSAALIGADGQLQISTRPEEGAVRDYSQREIFTVQQQSAADALYVDRPLPGSDVEPKSFGLSRRITLPSGEFGGIVVARVAFDYLARFYADVNVTPHTSIRLLRQDGVTLVRYPAAPEDTDKLRVYGAPVARADSPALYQQRGGLPYVVAAQAVHGYPIVVEVSRPFASVLQPWMQEERSSAARTLSLALLAALLLWTLRAALGRQVEADAERRRLEGELAAAQRIEALGSLAASVAHDFNNVLTAIIGYAELSRDMADADSEMSANLERLLAATERARLLVSRVLTFDPHRSLSYRATPVQPIVVEVSQQIQATLPATVRLELKATQGICAVLGDATEIYQVLMNLCSNAVHAMPQGGSLQIEVARAEISKPEVLSLGTLAAGSWVSVTIADSGTGLAAEQLMSIFEPFYTTRQPGQGTGIGLTVVRNIISRMHGALKVDSQMGRGTRMTVYWPAAGSATADSPDAASTLLHAGGGAGETILVIDDERELVALTEELLASLSYEPVGFFDGRAAIEAVRHDPHRFDAILTDERMQSLRGLDVARQIHAINPHIPILLMTAHRDADVDAQAVGAGIVDIIDKPLRVQTLRDALARQLHPGRSHDAV